MYTIDLAQELAHNEDLRKILHVDCSVLLQHQEQLQADLNSSLIRQMSEEDAGWWGKYSVKIRRLREREHAIGVSHAFIHAQSSIVNRMLNRRYFVNGLVDARIDEIKARLRERQVDSDSPNVFGNSPLYVVGK